MHQYWYVNSKGSGQLYNYQISVPPLYAQPQVPKLGEINGSGSPGGRVDPAGRTTPADDKGFTSHGQNGITILPVNYDDWESHEQLANWLQPADNKESTSQGNPLLPPVNHDDWESYEQPAKWPQPPEHPGFAPQGQHTPWVQPIPINHAGMSAQGQGQPLGWAPSAGYGGFHSPKQPLPWAHPQHIHHPGMFAQGHHAAFPPPPPNPFGFGTSGQQPNWGGLGNPGGQVTPMGWGAPGAPMGWGNGGGKGQPGVLGGLLKVGKGTMNGIGIISSLIGVGKFLF